MKNPIGFLSSTQNHHHYLYAESKTETAEKLRPEQKEREVRFLPLVMIYNQG